MIRLKGEANGVYQQSRNYIAYYVSLTAVLCLWLCGSNGAQSGFKIFRGEQDIFTNMKCYLESERCNDDQCKNYSAECVDAKCKFCRCMNGKSTFMINQDGGVCKSDEEIVPESVPNEAFWLKNNKYERCLKLESSSSNYIIGTNCIAWPTVDMLWIRINTINKQLMNVKTLKCIARSGSNGEKITINPCRNSIANWQKIQCTHNSDGMKIRWNRRRYLRLPNSAADGDAYAISSSNGDQRWRSKQGTTCITSTAYKGCYRFSDGSFMKYLNYNETKLKLRISAPIFKENDQDCKVGQHFKFIQNGQEWKDGRDSPFYININDDTKELKIRSMENLIPLNGSLLKLAVSCEKGDSKETYCVLLKLESLPPYSEVINRTPSPSPSPNIISTGKVTTAFSELPPTSVTSKNPQKGAREEESESGGTNAAAIAVTVTLLLVALALALGYLVYYRRRKKRAEGQQTNNNDIGTVNYSKEIYEDPDRIYETLKDDGDEVLPNQPGTSSDIYSNPDSNIVGIPASTEQEYTYANDTDFPRSSVGAKPAAKGPIRNGAVYETLEQPGQRTDDDFYNYPDNTNIAINHGSSELEYIYAKDTDLPRATADTKAVRERNSETATGGDLYHTLEQEGPASTEQEYSYAKNTDMPSIFRNPQVTYEIPNCGDHTYIDVIEDSNNTDSRNHDNSSTTA